MEASTEKLVKRNRITHVCTDTPLGPTAPKLQSLALQDLRVIPELYERLLYVLKGRFDHNIGLKSLVVEDCFVPSRECETELEALVEKITWIHVVEVELHDWTETEEETDSDSDSDSGD